MKPFVHLRQYSHYSLLESSFRINEIIDLCKEYKMPAIALTDKHNLFGAFEFSLNAQKNGIQPILGINLELKKIVQSEICENKKMYFVKSSSEKKYVPNFLIEREETNLDNYKLSKGLKLVGDFLEKNVLKPNNINYPISRLEFINLFK